MIAADLRSEGGRDYLFLLRRSIAADPFRVMCLFSESRLEVRCVVWSFESQSLKVENLRVHERRARDPKGLVTRLVQ